MHRDTDVQPIDRRRRRAKAGDPRLASWSHAGRQRLVQSQISVGGSLYIDDGRPTPDAFGETIRNIKEISPTFCNVPVGYAMPFADAMESDPELAAGFFKRMTTLGYAGFACRTNCTPPSGSGRALHRAQDPFLSGYGSTETAAATTYVYWATDRVGLIGRACIRASN